MNILLIFLTIFLVCYGHILQKGALESYLNLRKSHSKKRNRKSPGANSFLKDYLGLSMLNKENKHRKWLPKVLFVINMDFLNIPIMILMSILVLIIDFPQIIINYYFTWLAIKHFFLAFS